MKKLKKGKLKRKLSQWLQVLDVAALDLALRVAYLGKVAVQKLDYSDGLACVPAACLYALAVNFDCSHVKHLFERMNVILKFS